MGYKANIASNLSNQVIRLAVGALVSILVARTLGPQGQGYAAYILLVFTLIGDTGHLGLNNAVMYFQKRSAYTRSRLYSVNLTALGLIFLLIALVLVSMRAAGIILGNYSWLFIAGGLLLAASDLVLTNHQAWFVGDERIVENNRRGLLAFFIKSSAILLLWLFKALTPFSFFAVAALAMLLNALLLQARIGQRFRPQLDFRLLKSEFAYGGMIWLGAVFTFLIYRVDQLMIKQYLGLRELGVYSVAVTLAELMFLVPLSINSALLGKLYNTADPQASRRIMSQTLKLSLYVCLGLALIGIPLCLLIPLFYGAAYSGAVFSTMILLVGVVFASLANVSTQYFYTRGQPIFHLLSTGGALALNIALNSILIPALGIAGAALASSVSYFCYGLFYLALFICREKFAPRELFALSPSDIRELWRSK